MLVSKWLKHLGAEYTRIDHINHETSEIKIQVEQSQFLAKWNDLVIDIGKSSSADYSYWYRRAAFITYASFYMPPQIINMNDIKVGVNNELNTLNHFILDNLHEGAKFKINHHGKSNLNRLITLKHAAQCGLKTPSFLITNRKSNVDDFLSKYKKIVIKPISEVITIDFMHKPFTQYTRVMNNDDLKELPLSFFPSLFMEYIEKSFEIRSFYLDGNFYSMAMFTQKRKQTREDFRRYDYKNPVRVVPYKMSDCVENKIRKLFNQLEINSGSIDILKAQNCDELVFLEINPVGQFGMVSHPCNYYLEKRIAQNLINSKYENK
jgi:ATP-GRASP peptide maturase of grasp-with-spasm system